MVEEVATAADGTHPTGMHSCGSFFYSKQALFSTELFLILKSHYFENVLFPTGTVCTQSTPVGRHTVNMSRGKNWFKHVIKLLFYY